MTDPGLATRSLQLSKQILLHRPAVGEGVEVGDEAGGENLPAQDLPQCQNYLVRCSAVTCSIILIMLPPFW